MSKKRVLIVCTGNSARSQIAEAFIRHEAGGLFEVFSAGTQPTEVRAEAAEVLRELGIDISSHRAKPVTEFAGQAFDFVIAAGEILNLDEPQRKRLQSLRLRSAPNQIGRFGQLQKWLEDIDRENNTHRHLSHLWALHPGSEITPYGTPDLFKAARRSLEMRGDVATGGSMG